MIFARGGSKGIPMKNIAQCGGKPLITWTIETAKSSNLINRVIVCTDDNEIARISLACGALIPFLRPKNLAEDSTAELDVWKYAIREIYPFYNINQNCLISLPATSPLRSKEDIERCIKNYESSNLDGIVTICESDKSPDFNMITLKSNSLQIDTQNIVTKIQRRQDCSKWFDILTVCYVFNNQYVENTDHILNGKIGCVEIPKERSLDIDTPYQLKIANLILSTK